MFYPIFATGKNRYNKTIVSQAEFYALLYVGSKDGNVLKWNLNSVKPAGKQIEFDRKAIDINCTKIITI